MTRTDLMKLFADKCAELGQSMVAKAIGYSPSAVNQALRGKYQGDLGNLMQKVEEVYGGISVDCPLLGEIPLARCAEERRKPWAIVNSDYVRQRKACRSCERGRQ